DLVAFSGDKMLGGPQAGIIVGKGVLVARLRSNPLLRALRVDKITVAALAQTLRLYFSAESRKEIPFFAMLGTPLEALRARAQRYAQAVNGAKVIETSAYVGGGSLPESTVRSYGVALTPAQGADAAAQTLRHARVPVIGRIEEGRFVLDLRTILPRDDEYVTGLLKDL
ncbi:MAG TPA: hypothetical protein VIO32_05135, partial [Candidatus Baltobacteraceae bacterium]